MHRNPLLLTDSYKLTHWGQYPPGTERVYSYLEARTGGMFKDVVFFGLTPIIANYLSGKFCEKHHIAHAVRVANGHFGRKDMFNAEGWRWLLEKHNGRLPLEIKAVPEGTVVPEGNVLMTVENTDPDFWWLTNYVESLLVQVWYPCTVATLSREVKKVILDALEKSGTPSALEYKLHDFGFRGVSSVESAELGGMAHLVNFRGTDTLVALEAAAHYYGPDYLVAGQSVPAAEHSTITSWGKEREVDAYHNMLDLYQGGIVSVVSDSWDILSACEKLWGGELKDRVLGRRGVVVVRPDSGQPEEMVVKVLETLGKAYGTVRNSKGFKVLPDQLRVIQGDGMNYGSVRDVLGNMLTHHWSADNITFGMGGALLQQVNRDTQRFAFKCSAVQIEGVWRDVRKEVVSDPSKASKGGKLALLKTNEGWGTARTEQPLNSDYLIPRFKDGQALNPQLWETMRKRAAL